MKAKSAPCWRPRGDPAQEKLNIGKYVNKCKIVLYYHIKQDYFLKHLYLLLIGMYIKKMCIKLRTGNTDFFTDFCSKDISSNYPTEFILYLVFEHDIFGSMPVWIGNLGN